MPYRITRINHHPLELLNNSKSKITEKTSFKEIFHGIKNEHLKISKHAQERLSERKIDISTEQWNLIEEKVQEAYKKGVNDSLVLINDAALIISAKNNTVITAMNLEEAKSQIFTNINGTIIMD
ncbi:TIGR02530 family flagellar biosynthesis protein [Metabacillus fastidiosus]|uniref:TIGR02530 family flagellar biosynthesis protein n=1 Tax=Metabacillus fastidiosus TaxID=1458 RepID=UPI002E1ED75A|nr:TIGR02530 family flagellar biosynthesis protein [Metabacillus fastidiosus]MED4532511.1 TIGR02530 family flagellar biosynthesis protein [Metabacillus fastidiosus]